MARTRFAALALALAVATSAAAPARAADKPKRYGLEGMLVAYDAARSVFQVKVVGTSVSGFGGNTAGAPAPKPIKAGDVLELAVVPEGSVLRRTVIKGSKGGGLDNSGTREGFARAVQAIPNDRPVVVSFEQNTGSPPWVVRLVQIRMSPEEIEKRLREIGIDPAEAAGVERPEAATSEPGEAAE
jgi:hypothetical protein